MAHLSGNLALLIDADNVSYKHIAGLVAKVAQYGNASVRRIYGDWTTSQLRGWKSCLLDYSITLVQQFAYTNGKNATDIAMVINAMDLLHTGRFSSFALVSSDSDFTRLASRISEQGVNVYGFGQRRTHGAFTAACNHFVHLEALTAPGPALQEQNPSSSQLVTLQPPTNMIAAPASRPPMHIGGFTAAPSDPTLMAASSQVVLSSSDLIAYAPWPLPIRPASTKPVAIDIDFLDALRLAIDKNATYDGDYAHLVDVSPSLCQISPEIDPREFGSKLIDLVETSGLLEFKWKDVQNRELGLLVRLKKAKMRAKGE